jgi:hypothetical protein
MLRYYAQRHKITVYVECLYAQHLNVVNSFDHQMSLSKTLTANLQRLPECKIVYLIVLDVVQGFLRLGGVLPHDVVVHQGLGSEQRETTWWQCYKTFLSVIHGFLY